MYICRKHAWTAKYFNSAMSGDSPVPENKKFSTKLHSKGDLDMDQHEEASFLIVVSTGAVWQADLYEPYCSFMASDV